MYIPEFVVGFILGAVVAAVLITVAAWKYGREGGDVSEREG